VRAALVSFLLGLALAAAGAAATIPLAAYRDRLAAIDGRLRAGDWVGARQEAERLSRQRIAFGREELSPDLSLLAPLAAARDAAAARALAPRLARLAAALGRVRSAASPPRPRPHLLEQVRAREAVAAIPAGGRLAANPFETSLAAAIGEFLEPARRALARAWHAFVEWLRRLFVRELRERQPGFAFPWVVSALVLAVAALFAGLASRALRRRRRPPPEEAPAAAPPARDEDPLSREASEWEIYARQLAAAGRAREAVRAWYHAVLVALYRHGVLHYRKGRTNWEYVATVPPGLPWRPRFVAITRHFEREWYGRERSSPEALSVSEELATGLLAAVREGAR
jgi:uncharacterized protein DUF4129